MYALRIPAAALAVISKTIVKLFHNIYIWCSPPLACGPRSHWSLRPAAFPQQCRRHGRSHRALNAHKVAHTFLCDPFKTGLVLGLEIPLGCHGINRAQHTHKHNCMHSGQFRFRQQLGRRCFCAKDDSRRGASGITD